MELVLPMYDVHPYFSLQNLGKKCTSYTGLSVDMLPFLQGKYLGGEFLGYVVGVRSPSLQAAHFPMWLYHLTLIFYFSGILVKSR